MSAEGRTQTAILTDLALAQYERREFAACERTLGDLIAVAPSEAGLGAYRLLAKLKVARGEADAHRAIMGKAFDAHPGKTEFVAAFADTLPPDDAIALLGQHLREVRADPSRAAYILLRMTTLRAPGVRKARGLPEYGTSWADTYRWPDSDALAELKAVLDAEISLGSKRATARLDRAYIAVANGSWDAAEHALSELRNGPKRTPADFTAFGAAFHGALDAMEDADIFAELAAVEDLIAPTAAGEAIFMASDVSYFTAFTLPFLGQLDANGIALAAHIHLLDGAPSDWRSVRESLGSFSHLRPSLTAEASGAAARGRAYARNYYHSIRYVRFYEKLRRSSQPLWMLDCDVTLLRDPRPVFSSLAGYDLAIRTNPSSFEPVLKITASCVGASPTRAGLAFAQRVARYIVHWKNRGTWNWGVDQLALFSAYAHMSSQGDEPKTLFLDNSAVNDKTGDTGALRFMSGIDKHGLSAH